MKLFSVLSLLFLSLTALAEPGAVDVLVSKDGLPATGYELLIDNKKYKTDEFGYVATALEPGSYQMNIKDGESYQSVNFNVVEDERTQVLVNLLQGQVISDLNEPEVKKKTKEVNPKDWGEVKVQITSVNGEAVSGARIYARGTQVEAKTNRAGVAVFKLPKGEQVLSVTHPRYSTQIVRNVGVVKDQVTERKVEVTPSGMVLEDFVVLAPNLKGSIQALIEVRRKASDLSDVMSAEQMAKSGDSDAAASLKRVTGLTLKDGKYVYVRGLGERYSSTLLNGINLPSPDPSRRVVPLDLFPVQFLDSMIIQKSYSPNQPGEFGGGVVQLKTKSMPEKQFFKFNISQTQNLNQGNLQTYSGGSTDWLGVDDGSRSLSEAARDNPQEILNNNRHRLSDTENNSLPDFAFSGGDVWKSKNLDVGFVLSGLYKNNVSFVSEERKRYNQSSGPLVAEQIYTRDKTEFETTVGGLGGATFEVFDDHQVKVDHINLRNTTDYVAILQGNADAQSENGRTIREQQTEWAARTLQTTIFSTEHKFKSLSNLKLDSFYSLADARRSEPYRVNATYSPNPEGEFAFSPNTDNSYIRRYYDLQEEATQVGASAAIDFPYFYSRKGNLEVGFSEITKDRDSGMNRYTVNDPGDTCGADLTQNLDSIFNECRNELNVSRITNGSDTYYATQSISAYYFKTNWPLLKNVELTSGMRFERSIQNVDTLDQQSAQPIATKLTTEDWLPGNALTWRFLDKKMQVRLAYSETISRPDLRELSDTRWQDFETGFEINGNPNLKATVINSYDARWEWYYGRNENVSFGLFYKEFDNPIEINFTAGSDSSIRYFNVDGATSYGAEFEISKNLGFIGSFFKPFTFIANYTRIVSNVELGDLTNSESLETNRPMQGQSDYTANALLDYESEVLGTNASLAYNVYGERRVYPGREGLPNIWELPFHQLNFVLRQKMGKKWSLQFKAKNLLDQRVQFVQGDRIWQAYRPGISVNLGVGISI